MLAVRRAAAAVPKRAFASPVQSMGLSNLQDKEKAAEAVFFKYVPTKRHILFRKK